MNIIWGSKLVPHEIINLIFRFKNSMILFVDISKLKKNDLPIKLKHRLPPTVIDLLLEGVNNALNWGNDMED